MGDKVHTHKIGGYEIDLTKILFIGEVKPDYFASCSIEIQFIGQTQIHIIFVKGPGEFETVDTGNKKQPFDWYCIQVDGSKKLLPHEDYFPGDIFNGSKFKGRVLEEIEVFRKAWIECIGDKQMKMIELFNNLFK